VERSCVNLVCAPLFSCISLLKQLQFSPRTNNRLKC
jgi:hypothetical protein